MYRVREITHCKPGKVRPMVERSIAMAKLMEKHGQGKMTVMTDFVADRYWTIVCEYEVESIDSIMSMDGMPPEAMKEMEKIMEGYHDLVVRGKREIYKIEG
ncbi:MAG: hypothetical protein V4617_05370 [Gemmatimonadota bacterium]